MAKRIILISSFPLLIAIVIIVIILAGIGQGQPASTPANIDSARANIISLADAGKLAEMDAEVNKLTADYTDTAVLTTNYYIIADSFAWRRMNDRASRLYRLIIDKSPGSSLVNKARLGLARVEILGHIGEKNFSLAQEKLDSMIADFNNEPALSAALFQIGQEFSWQHRYIEAKDAFDHISSTDSLSQQAKLWSARANICSLLGKSPDSEIVATIDKMLDDFAGDTGLAEAIYWISKEYEWKKSAGEDRAGWYDAPNSVFQRLVQKFGNTSFGQDAEWDQKRLTHRMNIFNLMKEADQNAVNAEIAKMVADLSGRPEMAGELLWIAWGYEEQPGKNAQANQLYERIIAEFPGSDEIKDAYYLSGVFYSRSKEYSEAIERYKAVVVNWPNYRFAWNAWFMIGHHYQQLAETGDVPRSVADAETKAAYQHIINTFSDCPVNGLVNNWLKRHKED